MERDTGLVPWPPSSLGWQQDSRSSREGSGTSSFVSTNLLISGAQSPPAPCFPHGTPLPLPTRNLGFPGGSVVKNLPANVEDMGSIPGSGRSPGGGNGNPLQYFCLENPMDRRTWWALVHRVGKSWTWLSMHTQEIDSWLVMLKLWVTEDPRSGEEVSSSSSTASPLPLASASLEKWLSPHTWPWPSHLLLEVHLKVFFSFQAYIVLFLQAFPEPSVKIVNISSTVSGSARGWCTLDTKVGRVFVENYWIKLPLGDNVIFRKSPSAEMAGIFTCNSIKVETLGRISRDPVNDLSAAPKRVDLKAPLLLTWQSTNYWKKWLSLFILPANSAAVHLLEKWKWKSLSRVRLFVIPWTVGQNTGVGSLSLLQGIFPTRGSNPGLPHCRWILYQLSHKGSPRILEWVAYPFSRGSSWPRN